MSAGSNPSDHELHKLIPETDPEALATQELKYAAGSVIAIIGVILAIILTVGVPL